MRVKPKGRTALLAVRLDITRKTIHTSSRNGGMNHHGGL